jgi:toxin-antitoxin system PIN domain toxin
MSGVLAFLSEDAGEKQGGKGGDIAGMKGKRRIAGQDRDSWQHWKAKARLEEVMSGEEPVASPWIVLLGFVRISTNRRILSHPLSSSKALEIVSGWLALLNVRALSPGEEHWRILSALLADTGTAGNLTTDPHLAALTIEHGCELCSTDNDFARFPKLRWTNPLS